MRVRCFDDITGSYIWGAQADTTGLLRTTVRLPTGYEPLLARQSYIVRCAFATERGAFSPSQAITFAADSVSAPLNTVEIRLP